MGTIQEDQVYVPQLTDNQKIEGIKSHADYLIGSVMPSWVVDRANTGGPRVPSNVLSYVKEVREASDTLEGTLPDDFTDASHWPLVPSPIVFEAVPILTRKDDIWDRCTTPEADFS